MKKKNSFQNLLSEGTVVENMATSDVHSHFISKKTEKKDSQVQIPQLVKTSDDVTVHLFFFIKNQ